MKKNSFISLTAIVVMLSIAPTVFAAGTYSGGDGLTPQTAYQIADANDMQQIGANHIDWNKHFILTADVDLSAFTSTSFNIIGNSSVSFTGTFDGNGHTINNFTYVSNFAVCHTGLFGRLDTDAVVKDLGLINVKVDSGTDQSEYYSGASLVAINYGCIRNCFSTGSFNGSQKVGGLIGSNYGTVINSYSTCFVSAITEVGGLVGFNEGTLMMCYASGVVNGTSDYIGGLCGKGSGNLLSCFSTAQVRGANYVGGLIGLNDSCILTNCYSAGDVNGDAKVGGLTGYNSNGTVTNSYSTALISSSGTEVGGLIGGNDSGFVTNSFWDVDASGIGSTGEDNFGAIGKTTAQMKNESTFIDAGWDLTEETANGTSQVWQMPISTGYPVLSIFNGYSPIALSGDGSEENPYLIGTPMELGAIYHNNPFACYKLTADISLSDIQWSTAVIPVFFGYFDGAEHKIYNLEVDGGSYLGLFGYIGLQGTITDLGLENVSVRGNGDYVGGMAGKNLNISIVNSYTTGSVYGQSRVGGLVGYNASDVSNCYSNCIVSSDGQYTGGIIGRSYSSLNNCYSTGTVSSTNQYVGGFIGYSSSNLNNCYSTGTVSSTSSYVGGLVGRCWSGVVSNCYSTSNANGTYNVGGLVGEARSKITNSYATGTVTGQSFIGGLVGYNTPAIITNSYAVGNVTGDGEAVGGLVGCYSADTLTDCYSTGQVSGNNKCGGLVGILSTFESVTDCYSTSNVKSTGNYVGGLIGHNNSDVISCYATGPVTNN